MGTLKHEKVATAAEAKNLRHTGLQPESADPWTWDVATHVFTRALNKVWLREFPDTQLLNE